MSSSVQRRGTIVIPLSRLGTDIRAAAVQKQRAMALLRELEQRYVGQAIDKPGQWRHDPLGWQKRHQRQTSRPS